MILFHLIKIPGSIHLFWLAVPMSYHLNGSYHSTSPIPSVLN
jgi:hypothetical protein